MRRKMTRAQKTSGRFSSVNRKGEEPLHGKAFFTTRNEMEESFDNVWDWTLQMNEGRLPEEITDSFCLQTGDDSLDVDSFNREVEECILQNSISETQMNKRSTERLLSIKKKAVEEKIKERSANPSVKADAVSVRKKMSELTLHELADEIMSKVNLIVHENRVYAYNGRTYQPVGNSEELISLIRKNVDITAFSCRKTSQFSDLLTYLRTSPELVPEDYESRLESAKYLIVFENGVLDLKSLKLLRHSPEFLTFYELDARWNPGKNAKNFKKLLCDISSGDKEIELRVMESIGYLLTPLNNCKCFFVMGTARDSGKSTIGNFLGKVYGEKYISYISSHQISGRFSLGNTPGKLLNMAMDLPKGKLDAVAVATLKQITGEDPISVERKYENSNVSHSNLRFLFASNHPVSIPKQEDDDAFWQRMIIIPFLYSVEQENLDHTLLDKLLEEKDAIIVLCIEAFHKVMNNNFRFSECHVADEMKHKWRYQLEDNTGTLIDYVEECLEITGEKSDCLYVQDLFKDYQAYCSNCGQDGVTYNYMLRWMKSNLPECSFDRGRCNAGDNPRSTVHGLQIKDE